jgi:hypothetical protein
MASFKNISNDMAQTALKSVFTGETESLKNLGVVMTQAALEEFARSKGIRKKVKDMKEAEKVELRYQFVLSKTINSQGDYARTAQNAANQQRTWNENIRDMQARLGEKILPYYAAALQKLNSFVVENADTIEKMFTTAVDACVNFYNVVSTAVNFLQTYGVPIFSAVSGIVASMVTYKAIQGFQMLRVQMALAAKEAGIFGMIAKGQFLTAIKAMSMGIWGSVRAIVAQTAALLANPITWIVVAVGVLTAGLVWCALNWDKVTKAVQAFWAKVQPILVKMGEMLKTAFNFTPIGMAINAGKAIVNKVTKHNALGSNNFAGGATWVGEHGPEIAVMPRASSVLSNNKSMALAGGGGIGDLNFNITIQGNADAGVMKSAVNEVVPNIKRQIDEYFRQKQRLGLAFN